MMTEIERLISEGVFKPDFFAEEMRCDFFVDTARKKVWAIEIDLLLQLDRVCRKHRLQYYLMFGSLLGAIRHQGFIPWDDDLDVCMPRKDYEEFLRVAPGEFREPYFFQIPETDPGYYYTFAKIRNSNTAAFLPLFQYQRFNMGLFLDVFPVDVFDASDAEANFRRIQELTRENTTYMRMSNQSLSDVDKERVKAYKGGVPFDTYHEIQRIASRHEGEGELLEKRTVAVFTGYSLDKMVFNAADLSSTTLHDFEGFQFPIPCGYEAILRTTYGDYMKFPPVEKRGTHHGDYFIDPDRSYREMFRFAKK